MPPSSCPACGLTLPPDAGSHCPNCGFYLAAPAEQASSSSPASSASAVVCPSCSLSVEPDEEGHCPNCGYYLLAPQTPTQAAEEKPKAPRPPRKKTEARQEATARAKPTARKNSTQKQVRFSSSSIFALAIIFLLCVVCALAGIWLGWQRFFAEEVPTAAAPTRVFSPTNTLSPTKTFPPTSAFPPTVTFTPTLTFTPTSTLSPTPLPPTATPTLPVYPAITAQNADRLSPVVTVPGSSQGLGIAFSLDGNFLASANYDDGLVRLWDAYRGTLAREFKSDMKKAHTVAFSPDGRILYATGSGYVIYAFDVQTAEIVKRYIGHSSWVNQILFHPNGQWMFSNNGSVIAWNLQTAKVLRTYPGEARDMAFTPDGSAIAVPEVVTVRTGTAPTEYIAHNPIIRVRNIQSGETVGTYAFSITEREPGPVVSMDFTPDGGYIIAAGPENGLWQSHTNNYYLWKFYDFGLAEATDMSLSPDGSLIAVACSDFTIKIIDFQTQRLIATLAGHADEPRYVVFSPDGKGLASSGDDGKVIIWRVK